MSQLPPFYGSESDPQEERDARPVSNDARPRQMRLAVTVIVVAVIALVIIVFMTVRSCGRFAIYDSKADDGQLLGKTNEEIQAELDRQVEEGMFNISIASNVEFENGTAEGELRIENVPGNRYLMRVVITDDATGDVLYRTDLIKPDQHIQRDDLLVDLEPGVYACTAVFTAFEPDTAEEVGQAAAKMNIIVQG